MTWDKVGETVGKFAPLLGSALGPLGAVAGAIISSALGVENTPDKITQAIEANPQAALKLREIESNNELELQKAMIQSETSRIAENTKRILAVNATMQAETAHGGFSGFWRPYWGVISGTAFGVVAVFVCYLGYQAILGGKPEALNMIPQLITSMALLFGIPGAILGVTAYQRGKMQRVQAGENMKPGILKSLLGREKK